MKSAAIQNILIILCTLWALPSCEKPEVVEKELPLTPEEEALNNFLDNPEIFSDEPEKSDEPEEFVLNTSNEVSILGYHGFADNPSNDDMVITVKKFRDQMQALKDAEIPVISMSDFLDWRDGKINIPDQCVVITMDDGWVSVYTHALPILKEFGYPFSVYLYTKYISIGGRSLSYQQIKEIQQAGGEIGSHSISHADMNRKRRSLSPQAYEEWVHAEIGDSKTFIREKVGVDPIVFAYPYGNYNEKVVDILLKEGYVAGLTVNGAKVGFDTPLAELGRFIIHGNNDINFKYATSFRGRGAAVGSNLLASPSESDDPTDDSSGHSPLVSVFPKENSTIADRTPLISVDLSKLENIDEASIKMRVAGFGTVTPQFDAESKKLTYKIGQKIRSEDCQVSVTLERRGEKDSDAIVWKFMIDRDALYLKEAGTPPKAVPVIPPEVPAS